MRASVCVALLALFAVATHGQRQLGGGTGYKCVSQKQGCDWCASATACGGCIDQKKLPVNGRCDLPPPPCVEGKAQCTKCADARTCKACVAGYVAVQGQCLNRRDVKCRSQELGCDWCKDATNCGGCIGGRKPVNGLCINLPPCEAGFGGCQICKPNGSACARCQASYRDDGKGGCRRSFGRA
ncbi:hypothetical protein COHA_009579 [Chlorella ohadii]|uniref:Uncharacterized protein n=1 Tax=Chlorella ohadii TaxID=2649997 RepID=A0AAD5DF93_9CHLO|nr:hypothetical protein COHA_009579 [Chlorella ohadii]